MLKSVADIRKHASGAKVELPNSLLGLVQILNNYCHLLNVLFGPYCPHLVHASSIRDALETNKANLEVRLLGTLIVHLMWRIHHDAWQFFLACKGWDDKEWQPHSTLEHTIRQLVDDCSIQLMLTCPEALFLGPQVKVPVSKTTRTLQGAGRQPTVNPNIPPLCQKVVATLNRLYPSLTIPELCTRGNVKLNSVKMGGPGACLNFGLLGRCPGCKYKHKVCTMFDSWQAAIAKVLEGALATMKSNAGA